MLKNKFFRSVLTKFFPELRPLFNRESPAFIKKSVLRNSVIDTEAKLYSPYQIVHVKISKGAYLAPNASVSFTSIGKFCSIGPNFFCGYGIHPTNGISTSPFFYSTKKQNGATLATEDKLDERKNISIGNDVFIGANVMVLDGVCIGDGAVIGAGSIVSKDIPPYAIAVGNPIQVIKYRFSEDIINDLLEIKWWDWKNEKLKEVERNFFDITEFINKHKTN